MPADGINNLSNAELQVLAPLADGYTNREIAGILGVSPNTVKTHVGGILRKLPARRRGDAARMYRHDLGETHRPVQAAGRMRRVALTPARKRPRIA